jgi:hypothetical protein
VSNIYKRVPYPDARHSLTDILGDAMKHIISNRILNTMLILTTLLLFGLFSGCQKDNPVNVSGGNTALDDAAASVANAIGMNNGGALDQIGDVITIASAAGMQNEEGAILGKYASDSSYSSVTKTYDPVSGWWTLTLSRQRSGDFGYAQMYREYQYQFLNSGGNFQQYWLTGTDTAYSIHFKIVSGTGELHTLRLDHHLVSLSGEWMVTGTNTNTITVNTYNSVAYTRVGSDTITTENAVRTLNHTLTLSFIDVTGPRYSRLQFGAKVSGTITGTYHAQITFTRGLLYSEKTIDKTFTITLGGDGYGDIHCGERRFHANIGLGIITR